MRLETGGSIWVYSGSNCVEILSFVVTPFAENTYVLRAGGQAIVIDPGEAAPEIIAALEGYEVVAIVNTHCHIDHVGGNRGIKNLTGAPLLVPEGELPFLEAVVQQGVMFGYPVDPSPAPDGFIGEGDVLRLGGVRLEVLSAPGHSPDHMVLLGDGFVIGGDVLFAGSIGRTDLPGGDFATLMRSIKTKLWPLPDETVVYPGHGPETTIGEERASNPFLTNL